MSTDQPYHERPDVIAIHRAIGRYITEFSEMVVAMRRGIETLALPPEREWPMPDDTPLVGILTANMTAEPIKVSLFSACAELVDLNDNDRTVARVLQGSIDYFVKLRNDVAHADWSVGWTNDETSEWIEPSAIRYVPSRTGIQTRPLGLTPTQLDQESAYVRSVAYAVRVWVSGCRDLRRGATTRHPSDDLEIIKVDHPVQRAIDVRLPRTKSN